MKELNKIDVITLSGGFGYYPGYNADENVRGCKVAVGGAVGLVYGFFDGLWNTLVDNA